MGESRRKFEIVGAEMVSLIGAASCRSCEWRLKPPSAPGVLMCRRYPPQVVGAPIPDPRANGAWAFNAFYPQVNPDWPCGEYKRNDANAREEMAEAGREATKQ